MVTPTDDWIDYKLNPQKQTIKEICYNKPMNVKKELILSLRS
jgi:hypothetical protein